MFSAFVTGTRRANKLLRMNLDVLFAHRERRTANVLPASYWAELPHKVFQEHEPVFVLSTGRCGTRLLTDLFELVPHIACHHAPQPELLYCEDQVYHSGQTEFEAFKTAISTMRMELIADCVIRKRRYVETNRRITFFAPHLYELFPKSQFIHLVRHPGAFVRSGVQRHYYEGQHADVGRIIPRFGAAADQWKSMAITERCAWLWNETNSFIESFKRGRDETRILTVKAEDLFQTPQTATAIFHHLKLEAPSERLIQKRIVRPVNSNYLCEKLPLYEVGTEQQKDEVRRWLNCAETYGYQF